MKKIYRKIWTILTQKIDFEGQNFAFLDKFYSTDHKT